MNFMPLSLMLALILLGSFLLSLAGLAVLTFIDTPAMLHWRKQRLLTALQATRLHRMLIRLGVQPARFAEPMTLPALRQQIERCTHCDAAEQCDHSGLRKNNYAFCPNAQEIRWALRLQKADSAARR